MAPSAISMLQDLQNALATPIWPDALWTLLALDHCNEAGREQWNGHGIKAYATVILVAWKVSARRYLCLLLCTAQKSLEGHSRPKR